MDNKLYSIALNMVDGVDRVNYYKLMGHFGAPERVFSASQEELMKGAGIREKAASSIKSFRLEEELNGELNQIQKSGVTVLTTDDKEYPSNLKTIFDPPPVLYVRGKIVESDAIAVAVVGSRSPTHYGKLVTENMSKGLAEMGVTIVSGMARGIDSIAHTSAISCGGRTIAVLGCGLNIVYPSENVKLMNEIMNHGAVISEFCMSTKPNKMNFPQRNRVISGLSLGTVVTEAAEKSGSLITSRHAIEQGREVFAVPGCINVLKSQGTNRLIKMGAKLVESVEDIINEFPQDVRAFLKPEKGNRNIDCNLTGSEKLIFSLIDTELRHIDTIIEQSNLPVGVVSGILLNLELKGLIKQLSGKMFVRG